MRYWRRPLRDVTEPLNHAGFFIERVCEPDPAEALRIADPKGYARLERVPAFLFVRARKMGGSLTPTSAASEGGPTGPE